MRKIFFLVFFAFSLNLMAEERQSIATIIGKVDVNYTSDEAFPSSTVPKGVVIHSNGLRFYNAEAKLVRTLNIPHILSTPRISPILQNDFFLSGYIDLALYDSQGKLHWRQSILPQAVLQLKNGNLLVAIEGKLLLISLDGKILSSAEVPTFSSPHGSPYLLEHPEGYVFEPRLGATIIFFDRNLKKLREHIRNSDNPNRQEIRVLNLSSDGTIIVSMSTAIDFFDSKGNLKKTYTSPTLISSEVLPLTNGTILTRHKDHYFRFIDTSGVERNSHFHDSDFAQNQQVLQVNKDLIVYGNRTQLVFISLDGKELGSLPVPNRKSNKFVLADGYFLSLESEEKPKFYFIKMNDARTKNN